MTEQEVMSEKVALTPEELKSFCKKTNLPYHLSTLKQLNTSSSSIPKSSYVYTGSDQDDLNNGYSHHWLFLHGDKLFDSYGFQDKYKLPEWVRPVHNNPARLQQFGSDVCGEYCSRFNHYVNKQNPDHENLGVDFSNKQGYTHDHSQNDKSTLQWFKTPN